MGEKRIRLNSKASRRTQPLARSTYPSIKLPLVCTQIRKLFIEPLCFILVDMLLRSEGERSWKDLPEVTEITLAISALSLREFKNLVELLAVPI